MGTKGVVGTMTLEQAIAFAATAHQGQQDKAGAPYILHPLRVMLRLEGEDERRVGVLHDVMEDCGVTPMLLQRLGLPEREIGAVRALSKLPEEEGTDEGYQAFVDRVALNPLAMKVKLADLEDNLDASRLGVLTDKDRARLAKYERAKASLLTGR